MDVKYLIDIFVAKNASPLRSASAIDFLLYQVSAYNTQSRAEKVFYNGIEQRKKNREEQSID